MKTVPKTFVKLENILQCLLVYAEFAQSANILEHPTLKIWIQNVNSNAGLNTFLYYNPSQIVIVYLKSVRFVLNVTQTLLFSPHVNCRFRIAFQTILFAPETERRDYNITNWMFLLYS